MANGLIETPEHMQITSPEDQAFLDAIYADRQSTPYSFNAVDEGDPIWSTRWSLTIYFCF